MGDLDVRLLESPPRLARLLARAVATTRGRPGAAGSLPSHRLLLVGVRQDVPRLAEYCAVTGGLLSDRLPATWLHVLTFPLQVALMAGKDFPFPMLGMVHVANAMTLHRPVRVAEPLTLSSWAEALEPHRRGHTVDLVGEARVGEEVVWQGRSTYLVRSRDAGGPDAPGASRDAGGPDAPAGSADGAGPAEERHAIPDTELATWRLPRDLGRRYARVSGDANPIHLSAATAKAFGFPRAIAHGMWAHARVLASAPRLPESFTVDVQFVKPVLLPSTVVLRGARTGADLPAELALTSQDGTGVHLSARVTRP